MSRRCTSLAGDPSSGHRNIKILRFCGPPILGTPVCKAFQRPKLALIGLIDHVITPLTVCCFPALSRGATGTICFAGRCTGSRWTYASAPAGWRPLLAMGARCKFVPGLHRRRVMRRPCGRWWAYCLLARYSAGMISPCAPVRGR